MQERRMSLEDSKTRWARIAGKADMLSDNTTPHMSSVYDAQIRATIPYHDAIHEETIGLAGTVRPRPRCWLDTGCGTGTLASRACRLFPDTLFILADPSPEMLEEARKKFAVCGETQVRILAPVATQDICWEEEERPEVITAIQAHHYLDREGRRAATRKCYDLLADGGLYVTFENIRPFTAEGLAVTMKRWETFQHGAGKEPEAVAKHLRRFDVEYFPINVEEHLALLRECGFGTVEMLWFSYMQAGFFAIK